MSAQPVHDDDDGDRAVSAIHAAIDVWWKAQRAVNRRAEVALDQWEAEERRAAARRALAGMPTPVGVVVPVRFPDGPDETPMRNPVPVVPRVPQSVTDNAMWQAYYSQWIKRLRWLRAQVMEVERAAPDLAPWARKALEAGTERAARFANTHPNPEVGSRLAWEMREATRRTLHPDAAPVPARPAPQVPDRDLDACPRPDKRAFPSAADAGEWRRDNTAGMPGRKYLKVYRCACGWYHLGNSVPRIEQKMNAAGLRARMKRRH